MKQPPSDALSFFHAEIQSPASHPSSTCISPRRSLLSSTTPYLPGERLIVEMRVWHHIFPMATASAHPASSLSFSTTPHSLHPRLLLRSLSSWLLFSFRISFQSPSLPLCSFFVEENTLYCYKMKERLLERASTCRLEYEEEEGGYWLEWLECSAP